jgi:arsenate reductase (glutaredoxin)
MHAVTRGSDGRPAVTIYHNPKCGTSRNTLAIIRDAGIEPEIIEYLKQPPDKARLIGLMKQAGLSPRELIRRKEKLLVELGLERSGVPDAALLDAMVAHPILMNRPIVATAKGVRLCRPAELVEEILPTSRRLEAESRGKRKAAAR